MTISKMTLSIMTLIEKNHTQDNDTRYNVTQYKYSLPSCCAMHFINSAECRYAECYSVTQIGGHSYFPANYKIAKLSLGAILKIFSQRKLNYRVIS